tara:strand:+ start:5762 stop:5965 length:204 start_codon:yes stop_codon:yes gene_type:complete
MSKMKQVFQEEMEASVDQDSLLDAEWELQVRTTHEQQRKVLNDIFESWGEIFGVRDIKSKSNEEENF